VNWTEFRPELPQKGALGATFGRRRVAGQLLTEQILDDNGNDGERALCFCAFHVQSRGRQLVTGKPR
jgi:hypothetical protein